MLAIKVEFAPYSNPGLVEISRDQETLALDV